MGENISPLLYDNLIFKNTVVEKLTFSVDFKTIWFLTSKEKYMVIFIENALYFVTHQRQVGFAFLPFLPLLRNHRYNSIARFTVPTEDNF